MIRRALLLLAMLGLAAPVWANEAARGWCEAGAQPVILSGLASTTQVQASFPQCTVTVNIHGAGIATIFSDNSGTPLANPFTATTNGQWTWYAANGRYDVVLTCTAPCVPPTPSPFPVTYSDILLEDFTSGITFGAGNLLLNPGPLTFVSAATAPRSVTFPDRTDTVAELGAANAFTGPNVHTGTETFSGPLVMTGTDSGTPQTISGAKTFTGINTFSSINNVIYADQQSGADFCAKLITAAGLLPAAGGVVNALGFQGAQNCASATTLSKSGVTYLLPPNITVAGTAGVQILISGSDVQFLGSGDTTVFDFSAGTSATTPFLVRGGNRVTVANMKFIGNRVAGGTAATVNCSQAAGTFDRCVLTRLTVLNAGNAGIATSNTTNLEVSYNTVLSSFASGISIGSTASATKVLFNTIKDSNLGNISGQAGIFANDGAIIGNQIDLQVVGNWISQVTTSLSNAVGIQINGATGVLVEGNKVYQTTGSGEGIAVTAAKCRIALNEIATNAGSPAGSGILFFPTLNGYSDCILSKNTIFASTGLQLNWGANTITMKNVSVEGNRSTGGITTASGFTGMILSNVVIHDNDVTGSSLTLLTAGVTGFYNIWNNSGDSTAVNGTSILGPLTDTQQTTLTNKTITSPTVNALTASQSQTLTGSFANIGTTVNSAIFYLRDLTNGGSVVVTVDNTAPNVAISGAAGATAFVVGAPGAGQIGLQLSGGFLQIQGSAARVGDTIRFFQSTVQ